MCTGVHGRARTCPGVPGRARGVHGACTGVLGRSAVLLSGKSRTGMHGACTGLSFAMRLSGVSEFGAVSPTPRSYPPLGGIYCTRE